MIYLSVDGLTFVCDGRTAVLWNDIMTCSRSAGIPQADAGTDFSDESDISSYASVAVDWARANGIINGLENNRFDPQGDATRAQIAVLFLQRNRFQRGKSAEFCAGCGVARRSEIFRKHRSGRYRRMGGKYGNTFLIRSGECLRPKSIKNIRTYFT